MKRGECKHCHCTDTQACIFPPRVSSIMGGRMTCSWVDETHTLCNNPKCTTAEFMANSASGGKQ